jgi:hypothetical protein
MAKSKVKFQEGDVFAVPLDEGGYILGIIVRNNKIAPLGYFFKKVYPEVPDNCELDLSKDSLLTAVVFGVIGLARGEWPIIGRVEGFQRKDWPVPLFQKEMLDSVGSYAVEYSDDDFTNPVGVHRLPEEEVAKLPPVGLFGYQALISYVSMLLKEEGLLPRNVVS